MCNHKTTQGHEYDCKEQKHFREYDCRPKDNTYPIPKRSKDGTKFGVITNKNKLDCKYYICNMHSLGKIQV